MHSAKSFLQGFKGSELSVVSALREAYRGALTCEILFVVCIPPAGKGILLHEKKSTGYKHCLATTSKNTVNFGRGRAPTAAEIQGMAPLLAHRSQSYSKIHQHTRQRHEPLVSCAQPHPTTAERRYLKSVQKAQNLFQIPLGSWIVQRETHNPSYPLHFVICKWI